MGNILPKGSSHRTIQHQESAYNEKEEPEIKNVEQHEIHPDITIGRNKSNQGRKIQIGLNTEYLVSADQEESDYSENSDVEQPQDHSVLALRRNKQRPEIGLQIRKYSSRPLGSSRDLQPRRYTSDNTPDKDITNFKRLRIQNSFNAPRYRGEKIRIKGQTDSRKPTEYIIHHNHIKRRIKPPSSDFYPRTRRTNFRTRGKNSFTIEELNDKISRFQRTEELPLQRYETSHNGREETRVKDPTESRNKPDHITHSNQNKRSSSTFHSGMELYNNIYPRTRHTKVSTREKDIFNFGGCYDKRSGFERTDALSLQRYETSHNDNLDREEIRDQDPIEEWELPDCITSFKEQVSSTCYSSKYKNDDIEKNGTSSEWTSRGKYKDDIDLQRISRERRNLITGLQYNRKDKGIERIPYTSSTNNWLGIDNESETRTIFGSRRMDSCFSPSYLSCMSQLSELRINENEKYQSTVVSKQSNGQGITPPERAQEKTTSERNHFPNRKNPSRDVGIYVWNEDLPPMQLSKKSTITDTVSVVQSMLPIERFSSFTLFHGDKELQDTNDFEFALGPTSYPVRLDVVIHPDERIPETSLMKFNLQDMVDGDLTDDSTIMVQMSCDHATTPANLYNYCLSEIRRKKAEVICLVEDCKKVWNYAEILSKACLSDSERHLFEVRLLQNFLLLQENVFDCPSCGLMIELSSDCNKLYFQCCYCESGKFCRTCRLPMSGYTCENIHCSGQTQEINKTLAECRRKTIVGVSGCPVIRACPTCCKFIEHDEDLCKHMDCPSCECRFCFICLSVKTGDYWMCGGAFDRCSVATVQHV